MGQTPAKFFPWPTPFGQSPDSNVVSQAQAPPQAPLNNFLPLNPPEPAAALKPPARPGGGSLGIGRVQPRRTGADGMLRYE